MRCARRGERGMVTAFVTVMIVAIILVTGLVLDGGYILAAKREADRAADQAARAGAQQVSEDVLRGTDEVELDAGAAVVAAESFLARHGYTGDASVQAGEVVVTVTIDRPLLILGLAGIADKRVTGTGSSRPVVG